jgi:uncharacterized membrane protein HdeD (DUF308 family)
MIRGIIGVVLVVVGGVWIAQGTGVLGGSFMSGEAVWSVIGVIVALFGVALVIGALRRRADDER